MGHFYQKLNLITPNKNITKEKYKQLDFQNIKWSSSCVEKQYNCFSNKRFDFKIVQDIFLEIWDGDFEGSVRVM